MRREIRTMLLTVLCVAVGTIWAQEKGAVSDASANLIKNGDCEDWEWVQISPDMGKAAQTALRNKQKLGFEYKGMLFRRLKGYWSTSGFMVEGKDAWRGKSMVLPEGCYGLHSPFQRLIAHGKTYQYSVCLKGEGVFCFSAWVDATSKRGGESKWMGIPPLVKITVGPEWKEYTGTFKLPDYPDPDYILSAKVSCGIVIGRGDEIYVDDFKVWETGAQEAKQ